MVIDNASIHLIAGGVAGTVGAVITCPFEVVKTRLQSSVATFDTPKSSHVGQVKYPQCQRAARFTGQTITTQSTLLNQCIGQVGGTTQLNVKPCATQPGLWNCIGIIVRTEGFAGLFKGLGPNLVGVAPSRAIYFCTYANAKRWLNSTLPPDTPLVHILSAASAGFISSTATNPIWFIKTRIQLDQKRKGAMTSLRCIKDVYRESGLLGFYKGITASYYGISETIIHFVIYEAIKEKLREMKGISITDMDRNAGDFLEFMCAGATSKTIATCIAYPHEVARTRLRQTGSSNRYKKFWQTLALVFKEEGIRGLYRGLCTQLVRQIPNTAIMMSTYEGVVYMFNKYQITHDDKYH